MRWLRVALGLVAATLTAVVTGALVAAAGLAFADGRFDSQTAGDFSDVLAPALFVGTVCVLGVLPFAAGAHWLLMRGGQTALWRYLLAGAVLAAVAVLLMMMPLGVLLASIAFVPAGVAALAGAAVFWAVRRPDRDAKA